MELIVNDVYRARWKERTWGDQKDHCFEGIFVVLKKNNTFMFADTYWGIGDSSGKVFTPEQTEEKFELTYICNLDEIVSIHPYDIKYYDDNDLIYLSRQHACADSCKYYFIKKGAKRSQTKMVKVLNESIEYSKRKIEWETSSIKENSDKLAEVISGNLDIYI